MISNIREAFIELLVENHWMDETTRQVAKEKALKMNERIGYPEFLTRVSELNKEYANVCNAYLLPTDVVLTVIYIMFITADNFQASFLT